MSHSEHKKLTRAQLACLVEAWQAREMGYVGAPLRGSGRRARNLRWLNEHNLLYRSEGRDGSVLYCLTSTGERALTRALQPRPERAARPPRRGGVCPNCGTRPKHVYASGKTDPYCTECRRERQRACWARRTEKLLAAAAAGEIACKFPGCDRPVYYTQNYVSFYCSMHAVYQTRKSRLKKARRGRNEKKQPERA